MTQDFDATSEFYNRFFLNRTLSEDEIERIENVAQTLNKISSKSIVLEIGCGAGDLTARLYGNCARLIISDVTIVDKLRDYAQLMGLDYIRCSVTNLPIENGSIDTVIFSEVIEHLPIADQSASLQEIHRCLKPSGLLILSTPNPSSITAILSMIVFRIIRPVSKVKGQSIRNQIHMGKQNKQLIENWIPPKHLQNLIIRDFEIIDQYGSYYVPPIIGATFIGKWIRRISEAIGRRKSLSTRGLYQYYLVRKRGNITLPP